MAFLPSPTCSKMAKCFNLHFSLNPTYNHSGLINLVRQQDSWKGRV